MTRVLVDAGVVVLVIAALGGCLAVALRRGIARFDACMARVGVGPDPDPAAEPEQPVDAAPVAPAAPAAPDAIDVADAYHHDRPSRPLTGDELVEAARLIDGAFPKSKKGTL